MDYKSILRKLTGRKDVKSYLFKEGIALTVNGWLKEVDNNWLVLGEANKDVILIRLRYGLGNYRFTKDDNKRFRETYRNNMIVVLPIYKREKAVKKSFSYIKGELDIDKIKTILKYQKQNPENERVCTNCNYRIITVSNYNNNEIIPCIETRRLIRVDKTVSNRFSLGNIQGYINVENF